MVEKNKEIEVFNDTKYEILNSSLTGDFKAAMEINLEGEDISLRKILTNINMPVGTTPIFNYSTIEGDVSQKELKGIIIHIQSERALFLGPYGKAKIPVCTSSDGRIGVGDPGGDCLTCVQNQFGPNNEKKPCKETKATYILMEGEALPVVLRVPPGSFKSLQNYRIGLARKGIQIHTVETIFALQKTQNAEQIDFLKLDLRPGARITDPQTIAAITKIRDDLTPFLAENHMTNNHMIEEAIVV